MAYVGTGSGIPTLSAVFVRGYAAPYLRFSSWSPPPTFVRGYAGPATAAPSVAPRPTVGLLHPPGRRGTRAAT